jgi:hypothetical protein
MNMSNQRRKKLCIQQMARPIPPYKPSILPRPATKSMVECDLAEMELKVAALLVSVAGKSDRETTLLNRIFRYGKKSGKGRQAFHQLVSLGYPAEVISIWVESERVRNSMEANGISLAALPKLATSAVGRFKSNARWPKGTFDSDGNVTTDTHDTEGQAKGVCKLLRDRGAGGAGEVFPLETWTTEVRPDSEKTVEQIAAEVFDPRVSDLAYFQSRKKALGI